MRLQLRYDAAGPNPADYGTVLMRNGSPQLLQAVLQDPRIEALEALHRAEGVHDVQVTSLHLEDIYLRWWRHGGQVMTVKLLWKEYRTQWAIWLGLRVGLLLVDGAGRNVGSAPQSSSSFLRCGC